MTDILSDPAGLVPGIRRRGPRGGLARIRDRLAAWEADYRDRTLLAGRSGGALGKIGLTEAYRDSAAAGLMREGSGGSPA